MTFEQFICGDCVCWNPSHTDTCGELVGQCFYNPPSIDPAANSQSRDAEHIYVETSSCDKCWIGYRATMLDESEK